MKREIFFSTIILCGFVLAGTYLRAEDPSAELIQEGKKLFTTKELLGAKYPCILCHKGQKAIKKSKIAGLGDKLSDVINKYLVQKAKGKPLAKDSRQMQALVAYIVHEHSV